MQKIFIYAIRWEKREKLKVFMDRKDIFVFLTHHPILLHLGGDKRNHFVIYRPSCVT